MLRSLILVSLVFLFSASYAQRSYSLSLHVSDKDSAFVKKNINYNKVFSDTLSALHETIKALNSLYANGYLFAQIDSFKVNSSKINAYLTAGGIMKWLKFKSFKIDPILLERAGFKEKYYDGKVYNNKQIVSMYEAIIDYCENNGYPFASVKLDSVDIRGDSISAQLVVAKNKLIVIDSIHVTGDVKISKTFLYNYFDIKPGSPYDETKIRAIAQKLKEMQFLAEQKPYTVMFNDKEAEINLFLKNKTASTLNFLIGFAPNSSTTGGLAITGQGQLYLSNPLGHGESLNINFNKDPSGTTQLQSEVKYPYILSLPIGIDASLNLYKQDSSYLNVDETLGLEYLLTGANFIKAFYKNESSIALTIDTATIIATHQLPPVINVSTGYYGLELYYENLDYRFNPSHGYSLDVSGAVGERVVKEDSRIVQLQDPTDSSFNFASLYDTVKLRSISYNLSLSFYKYFHFLQRNVIKTGVNGAAIISPGAVIYTDELFTLGGINNIRGFDENSIYASQYAFYTLEYRYLLGLNSYFNIFNDDAYIIDRSDGTNTTNFLIGIGVGLAFESKAGIFNISYALGRSNGTTFQFKSAKIEFGYVNYF